MNKARALKLDNFVHIRATINCAYAFQCTSISHRLRIVQEVGPSRILYGFFLHQRGNFGERKQLILWRRKDKVVECDRWENRDFEISYTIPTPEILCSLLVNEANIDPFDKRHTQFINFMFSYYFIYYRATFCVNIHPPPDQSLPFGFFGRRIVFLIGIQKEESKGRRMKGKEMGE